MKQSKPLFATALIVTLLTGCSGVGSNKAVEPDVNVVMPRSQALVELRDIAVEARHELRLLSKSQEALNYRTLTPEQEIQRFYQSTVVPAGFEERVTFAYPGDAVKAAKAIALVAGYDFVVEGRPLLNEPQVNIHIENQPLNEALRELGVQTGSSVLIALDEGTKVMKYVYKPRVK